MSNRTDIEQRIVELEQLAQRAAEERIEDAFTLLNNEADEVMDFLSPEDQDRIESSLAGPFCGCMTCEVREILHAAYPHLRDIALLEAQFELPAVGEGSREVVCPTVTDAILRSIPVIKDAGR